MSYKRLSEETKDQIIKAINGNETIKSIADRFNVSDKTVYNVRLSRGKISKTRQRQRKKPYVEHVEIPQAQSKIACIIGSPQEIAAILKGMA